MTLTPFVISCDISNAFDNVDTEHLKHLVETLFKVPNYQIITQELVVPTFLGLRSFYKKLALPTGSTSSRETRSSEWNGGVPTSASIAVRAVGLGYLSL